MAITLDHTEGNSLSWTDATPAKGVTSTANIDAGAGSYFDYVNVVLSVAGAATIDGAGVDVQVSYAADSSEFSDTNITIFNIAAATIDGLTAIYAIKLSKFNFAKIGVFNNTDAAAEVTPTGSWEGVKVSDA
jgi:hypothetical protein